MSSKIKLLIAAAIAMVAFAAFASGASASRAAIERGGSISSPSLGKVTFGSEPRIECNLTMNGTLATSVELTSGSHMGSVTEVRIANCTGGSVERVLELPWELTVNSLLGTAPGELTGILFNIRGAAFNLSTFFNLVNCLYKGTAGALLEVTGTGTNTYSTALIIALEEVLLPFIRGSGACPRSGGFAGTFGLSPLQTIVVS